MSCGHNSVSRFPLPNASTDLSKCFCSPMKKEEMILKSTSISFVMGMSTWTSAPVNLKENSGIQVNKEPSLGLEIPDSMPLLILGEEPACLEELMSSRIWEVGMKSPLLFKAVEVQDRWGGKINREKRLTKRRSNTI